MVMVYNKLSLTYFTLVFSNRSLYVYIRQSKKVEVISLQSEVYY